MVKNRVFKVRIDEQTLMECRAKTRLVGLSFSAYIRGLIAVDLLIGVDSEKNFSQSEESVINEMEVDFDIVSPDSRLGVDELDILNKWKGRYDK